MILKPPTAQDSESADEREENLTLINADVINSRDIKNLYDIEPAEPAPKAVAMPLGIERKHPWPRL